MKKFILAFIRFYQRFISPLSSPSCRFYPSCSQYALEAVQIYGAGKGSWLGFKRLFRCHPWGGSGIDFVPTRPINWQELRYQFIQKDKHVHHLMIKQYIQRKL